MSSSQESFQEYSESREPKHELDSPFLNEALFVDEEAEAAEVRATRLMELQTPFLEVFEEGYEAILEPEIKESEEFLDELDEEEFDEEAFANYITDEGAELENEELLYELDEDEFDEELAGLKQF